MEQQEVNLFTWQLVEGNGGLKDGGCGGRWVPSKVIQLLPAA